MRGEELGGHVVAIGEAESPPHARGRGSSMVWRVKRPRITPACAGKRGRRGHHLLPDQNHPRMHGEEPLISMRPSGTVESPPHARGRVDELRKVVTPTGITPACAGKRVSFSVSQNGSGNHPRMRGEERGAATMNCCLSESPPHARGREICETGDGSNLGITPACAGKRRETFSKPLSVRNHPRMRGEESNENAASEDMAIPPKSGFSAPFQEPPPSAA